jgi:hypothetical protein
MNKIEHRSYCCLLPLWAKSAIGAVKYNPHRRRLFLLSTLRLEIEGEEKNLTFPLHLGDPFPTGMVNRHLLSVVQYAGVSMSIVVTSADRPLSGLFDLYGNALPLQQEDSGAVVYYAPPDPSGPGTGFIIPLSNRIEAERIILLPARRGLRTHKINWKNKEVVSDVPVI